MKKKSAGINLQIALFGCEAFRAAAPDLDAHHLLKFIRQEVQELERLNTKKNDNKVDDGDKEKIKLFASRARVVLKVLPPPVLGQRYRQSRAKRFPGLSGCRAYRP